MIEIQLAEGVAPVDTEQTISITPTRASNSVVVVAPPAAMTLIKKITQELDQSAAQATTPSVVMYPLKHAEVGPTVSALQEIFQPRSSGSSRVGGAATLSPVRIAGDEGSGRVLVSAPTDKQELIAKVIKDLDNPQGLEELTIKVYRIQPPPSTKSPW